MDRRSCPALLCLLAFGVLPGAESTAQGALKLDNYTFDKVLALDGYSVLAKFDQSYAYGEKEDEFKVLCKLAHGVPKFFVAEVPVQEYGDKENDDLRERFKLTKDDFPAYFLFSEANKEGLRYSGAVKADAIGSWLRRNQVKLSLLGSIAELDEVVKRFFQSGFADSEIDAAKKLAEGQYSTDKKAGVYVKIMQKIKEKGEAYVEAESTRVGKILEGKVTPEKSAELNDKLKVLSVFASKDEL